MKNENNYEKHGMYKSPEYGAYHKMLNRCHSEKCAMYADYGGRGIFVSDSWRECFGNFYSDMGSRPTVWHSLDRIDNNSGYSKENCRWATKKEQSNNHRRNRIFTILGFTDTLTNLANRFGIDHRTVRSRLTRGIDPVVAFTSGDMGRGEIKKKKDAA